ncbi:MAG: NADH-quinone oxidoreductase subunit N [Clostridia bacterium]|nr:NADH-quinone oxidoreductase subunit N [Clostridia bacterium]
MPPVADLAAILPELILTGLGLLLLLVAAFVDERGERAVSPYLTVAGLLVAFASLAWTPLRNRPVLGGMVHADLFTLFFRMVLIGALLIVVLMSGRYAERRGISAGAFYALLVFATVGALFFLDAGDAVSFYVGLETLTIPSYLLAGMLTRDARSNEAALKYFLNGAVASAILLFGFSLLYGATGTTALAAIATRLAASGADPLALSGLLLVLVGLGFKVSAVPFHLWAPDTYEGSPTPVTAFLSVVSKGAAFAAILRLLFTALTPLRADWSAVFAVLSLLSMIVGNVSALHQRNLKRLLAYSSIAHAGYVMAGLAAGTALGFQAVMFYVLVYAVMNLGAFAVVVALGEAGEEESLEGIRGLGRRNPWLAAAMTLFLLSLIGIPFFPGFWGKLYLFQATVQAGMAWLAITIGVNSAVSVYYYYGVIHAMFVQQPEEGRAAALHTSWGVGLGVAVTALAVLLVGLAPGGFLGWVAQAAWFR